jgi:iron complex outermembrane recepter protein
MKSRFSRSFLAASALSSMMIFAVPTWAQDAEATPAAEDIVVTGTRIKSAGLTATSPVSELSSAQIALQRSVTVEDLSVKLPQLAGGVNSTSVGSDAFGAQTLDLRNLGQNRTLVLINGTRAVPFSFRNAVDVNSIPAPLLKRVDVLTGGAAAVYGADAVAGVVNFIINDDFEGVQAGGNYRAVADGASQYSVNAMGGLTLGDRGNIVVYGEYTKRNPLFARSRPFSLANGIPVAGNGGNFRDVASGRTFSFDSQGRFTLTPQTTDYTSEFTLVQPLERINADAFFKYDLTDGVEAYGRVMYSNVKSTGASRSGQSPAVVNQVVSISAANPFLPPEARALLTFVNGAADVNVNRSLGELGVITASNDRDTLQGQLGLRGAITPAINWDAYLQYGKSKESIVVNGDGSKADFTRLAPTLDLFGPGADLSGVGREFSYGTRTRTQKVGSAYVSGDTSDFFNGWAGPFGFTLGYEYRKEVGKFNYTNTDLTQSFRQGAETPPPGRTPFIAVNEVFGELVIPILADVPFIQKLTAEGAYRRSWYKKSVGADNRYDTNKIGLNWTVSDDLRLRATRQVVIRAPNIGEFANGQSSIPFSSLVSVARLRPRYQGDPCVLGTGNAEQCRRFNAPAVGSYNSLDAANLVGNYFFGGNPDIGAEKGTTYTLGAVATPRFLPGFTVSVDYYKISLKDAVGQIQPVDALTSCYITDPRADNPLCAAVSRGADGRILDGFPIDRNLAFIKQNGLDVDMRYAFDAPEGLGKKITIAYQASIVTKYTIQRNAVLAPIDCKGRYAFRCSSDAVSLVAPDFRHRATFTWDSEPLTVQLGWKRIGLVQDSNIGSADFIKSQNYYDLNIAIRPPIEGVTFSVGIDNLFDKKPPILTRNAGAFNTYPDTYDILGRTFGFSLTVRR